MKKIFFLTVVAFIVTSFVSNAQGIHLGIKAGGNATKLDGQPFDQGFKFAYHAGAFLEINFNNKWGIQPEVLFSQSQTQTVQNAGQIQPPLVAGDKLQLNYLSVPILLNYKPSKLVTLQLGPQYSILMNSNSSLGANINSAFKSGDFAMAGGVQLNFAALKIYGRYLIGLNDVSDVSNQNNWKSQQIQAGIALKLF